MNSNQSSNLWEETLKENWDFPSLEITAAFPFPNITSTNVIAWQEVICSQAWNEKQGSDHNWSILDHYLHSVNPARLSGTFLLIISLRNTDKLFYVLSCTVINLCLKTRLSGPYLTWQTDLCVCVCVESVLVFLWSEHLIRKTIDQVLM